MKTGIHAILAAIGMVAGTIGAHAAQPTPWGLGFQAPATSVMEQIRWFEQYTLWFIVPITLFVLGLLAYVTWRFSAARNPRCLKDQPQHADRGHLDGRPGVDSACHRVPSFSCSPTVRPAKADDIKRPAISGTGAMNTRQRRVTFEIYLNMRAEIRRGRKAAVTRRCSRSTSGWSCPVGKTVQFLVTADDVIHSFAVPAFWIKLDANPGQLNETWVKVDRPGVYYGQCSELCGARHGYMPIAVEAASRGRVQRLGCGAAAARACRQGRR